VVTEGAICRLSLVKFPGIHEKEVPGILLSAVIEDISPAQIAEGFAEAVIWGLGFIVRVTAVVSKHPAAFPIRVKVVVDAGDTEMIEPIKAPGIHEKVVPTTVLIADKVEENPLQIDGGEAKAEISGTGFTVTETVADPVQPSVLPVTV
jgi:hypothetical protein